MKQRQRKKWIKKGVIGTLVCACFVIVIYCNEPIIETINGHRNCTSSESSLISIQQLADKVIEFQQSDDDDGRFALDIPGLVAVYARIYKKSYQKGKVFIEIGQDLSGRHAHDVEGLEIAFDKGEYPEDNLEERIVDGWLENLHKTVGEHPVSGDQWLKVADDFFKAVGARNIVLWNRAKFELDIQGYEQEIPVDFVNAITEGLDTYYGKRGWECKDASKQQVEEFMEDISNTKWMDITKDLLKLSERETKHLSKNLMKVITATDRDQKFGAVMKQLWEAEDKTDFVDLFKLLDEANGFPLAYDALREKCNHLYKDYSKSC